MTLENQRKLQNIEKRLVEKKCGPVREYLSGK